MKNSRTIDLSLLPVVDKAHAWLRIDEAVERRVTRLSRTSDRMLNAVRFIWFSGVDDDSPLAGEPPRIREGFIRATLAELVSVEEILPADLKEANLSAPPFRMNDSKMPHLHLVRELRNHELHLHHNRVSEFKKSVLWGRQDQPDKAHRIEATFWTLGGVTEQSFSALKNAKNYTQLEIKAMIDWFNSTQADWGVQEILLRVVQDYAEELCSVYQL